MSKLIISLSVIAVLMIVAIFGFYLIRKVFFYFKWKNKNKKIKEIKQNAENIKKGNMLNGDTFEKVSSKKDNFIDANTLQRERDVNYAYQNITYRNVIMKDIYAGYKALDKFAGQKTISALKSKKTSDLYPTKPEKDIDKKNIKSKHAKIYLQEHNILYSYTPKMSFIEMFFWSISLIGIVSNFIFVTSEIIQPWIGFLLLIPFAISLVMWGLRFLSFGLQLTNKNKEKIAKSIFEDVKTIQWLDDIMTGFLDRNPHYLPILTEAFQEED